MFALTFRFPTGRYHATPWGRNVNEADVAWPPEPWRLLRTLIATWRGKGDCERWSEDDFTILIEALAEVPPVYHLPKGAIHSHTRHYMPQGTLDGKGQEKRVLVFDGFVHLPANAEIVVAWPDLTLNENLFDLAADLADSIGYLGRAESWTECQAMDDWSGEVNCRLVGAEETGTRVRSLAPRSSAAYSEERQRLIEKFGQNASFVSTLPEQFVDALALDTADYQDQGWSRPPAAQEVIYGYCAETTPNVIARGFAGHRRTVRTEQATIARFLVAGRPLPRIEDAVKIGELMRRAALAKFGWRKNETTGALTPCAPWQISGRDANGRPLADPAHPHAFWLSEDADLDGWIDHISVYIKSGIGGDIRARLDQITRLWFPPTQRQGSKGPEPLVSKEWRLALEGFGHPADFAGSARIFGKAKRWQSVTPFLAAGYLRGSRYQGEVRRLLQHRGFNTNGLEVEELTNIAVGGTKRRVPHFYRFRSRGGEKQPHSTGTFLRVTFPEPITGPLAIGFGSHFGLGLFSPMNEK